RCQLFEIIFIFKFFFSSRRRHTRFSRDWSSDVCSSDLGTWSGDGVNSSGVFNPSQNNIGTNLLTYTVGEGACTMVATMVVTVHRSEERRVGKECRFRLSP